MSATGLQRAVVTATGELAASDSLSDSGASGTAAGSGGPTLRDAKEDAAEVAAALGIAVEDVFTDRVRIDRRCLEKLILGEEEMESAEVFFQNIMDRTHTRVVWPAHLKIGSRSRKSPHVVIAGLFNDVLEAKKEVVARLDSPDDRVTMKLDLSYLYHSHMIGRGGLVIKKVMDETGTHIHFPDSNRNSTMEKSSQVSLAGRLAGVEQARQRVRKLMPLVFFFDAPPLDVPGPDAASPFVLGLQQKYRVQVRFRHRHRLHGVQVQVKGCEWEVEQVTEATLLLTRHLCAGTGAIGTPEQISVYTTLEVSPSHQPLVLGTNNSNIKMIMKYTKTQIMVPDLKDPNIPPLKKNIIMVTGPIRNVYLARQQLLGSLPILLMFEVSDYAPVDYDHAAAIMRDLDVQINFRRKEKQRTIAITIKGIERDATNVYEARRQLLGLEGPRVVAEIPTTYLIPGAPPVFHANFSGRRGFGAGAEGLGRGGVSLPRRGPASTLSPETRNGMWLSPYDQLSRNMGSLLRRRVPGLAAGGHEGGSCGGAGGGGGGGGGVAGAACAGPCTAPCGAPCTGGLSGSLAGSHSSLLSLASSLASCTSAGPTHRPDSGYAASTSPASSLAVSPCPGGGSGRTSPASSCATDVAPCAVSNASAAGRATSLSPRETASSRETASTREVVSPKEAISPRDALSPVSAISVASVASVASSASNASNASNMSVSTRLPPPPPIQPTPPAPSPLQIPSAPTGSVWPSPPNSGSSGNTDDPLEGQFNSPSKLASLYGSAVSGGMFPDMVRCPDRRAPGYEKKTLEYATSASDYTRQMAIAYKAMQEQPVPTQTRIPTPLWSGMGFSRSSPVSSPTNTTPRNPMSPEPHSLWRSSPSGSLAPRLAAVWSPRSPGDGDGEGMGIGAVGMPSAGCGAPQVRASGPAGRTGPAGASSGSQSPLLAQPPGDIVGLLTALGLQKYIDVFLREEIDLQAFRALTEGDLLDIGVVAVGTRRKMLDAISELRARHGMWRRTAPGENPNCSTALGGRPQDGSPSHDRW